MGRENKGRGGKGACGGKRRQDSSGSGTGNRNTKNQPSGKNKWKLKSLCREKSL